MTVHHVARMRQPETACLLGLTEDEVAAHRAVVAAVAVNLAPGVRWQADWDAGGQVEDGKRATGLRITRVFSCVVRGFKGRPSFMFADCCWWRSLAVDGS